ncbi:MAG: hypothetical protein AAF787_15500, partial [Chloroflexota bacterium]
MVDGAIIVAYKAKQLQPPPGTEVMGAALMGFFDNLSIDVVDPVLRKHGFKREDIDPGGWYPAEISIALERAFMNSDYGGKMAIVAIGKASAQNVVDPESYEGFSDFLENNFPNFPLMYVRNTPEGYGYIVEKVQEGVWKITNNTPISNHSTYGFLWEC